MPREIKIILNEMVSSLTTGNFKCIPAIIAEMQNFETVFPSSSRQTLTALRIDLMNASDCIRSALIGVQNGKKTIIHINHAPLTFYGKNGSLQMTSQAISPIRRI